MPYHATRSHISFPLLPRENSCQHQFSQSCSVVGGQHLWQTRLAGCCLPLNMYTVMCLMLALYMIINCSTPLPPPPTHTHSISLLICYVDVRLLNRIHNLILACYNVDECAYQSSHIGFSISVCIQGHFRELTKSRHFFHLHCAYVLFTPKQKTAAPI